MVVMQEAVRANLKESLPEICWRGLMETRKKIGKNSLSLSYWVEICVPFLDGTVSSEMLWMFVM
jgi:hypothetical protein